jgi:hypothetical protein
MDLSFGGGYDEAEEQHHAASTASIPVAGSLAMDNASSHGAPVPVGSSVDPVAAVAAMHDAAATEHTDESVIDEQRTTEAADPSDHATPCRSPDVPRRPDPSDEPQPRRGSHRDSESTQLSKALEYSFADKRMTAVTPEQRRRHDEKIQQHLHGFHRQLRPVPGNGDCLFASVLLGCEAIGVDVAAERQLKSAHALHLRVYMAEWIRSHKQALFDHSGGDDTWRGEVRPPTRSRTRTRRTSPVPEPRMTLDECLDLLADPTTRQYDIPWGSTEPGAAPTNLGDYLPQLLAVALGVRIVLLMAFGPPETVGLRDPSIGRLQESSDREVMVVQSVSQNHWDAAVPLASAAATRAANPVSTTTEPQLVPAAANTDTHASADSVSEQSGPFLRHIQPTGRRIFADAPDRGEVQQRDEQQHLLAQQLAEAQSQLKMCQQRMAEQHAAALAEQAAEAEEQAKAVARARNRMEELVHLLQSTHQDHVSRVCQPGVADLTGDALRELAQLQSALPAYADAPFHDVPDSMVDQWTTEIEELETALAGPWLPSPVAVDAAAAQVVCTRLNEMWQQLQDAPASGLPLLQMLLLTKKLRCVDQLRPDVDDTNVTPYECFELRALLVRLCAHDHVWSFTFRFPCSYFDTAPSRMKDRAANFYVKASRTARPDVQQQARLLVEQCKVLESAGQLSKAKGLDSVVLEYPEAPLGLLHRSGLLTEPGSGSGTSQNQNQNQGSEDAGTSLCLVPRSCGSRPCDL